MSSSTQHPPLEPLAPAIFAVVLGHILLGMVAWIVLPLWKVNISPITPKHEQESFPPDQHYWFSPADFKSNAPKLVVAQPVEDSPQTDVPVTSQPVIEAGAQRPTSKNITLSPVLEDDAKRPPAKANRPPITLMEVIKVEDRQDAEKRATGGADMDPVLNALEKSLKKEWNAPPVQQVPILQRQVRLTLSIGRDGSILETHMTRSSGSVLLDQSVNDAAGRLKKISEALPSSFPKDRYTVEVNFHIE